MRLQGYNRIRCFDSDFPGKRQDILIENLASKLLEITRNVFKNDSSKQVRYFLEDCSNRVQDDASKLQTACIEDIF